MPLATANAIGLSFLPLKFLFPPLLDGMGPACGHLYPTALSRRMLPRVFPCWGEDEGFLREPGAAQPMGLVTTSGMVSVLRDERGGSCRRNTHSLQLQKIPKQNSGKLAG